MKSATEKQQAAKEPPNGESGKRRKSVAAPREQKLQLGVLNGHLGYFVRRLQVAIFRDIIRVLAPMKVRPAQYSVLVLVDSNPGRSQAAIGRALGIERARLARLLHDLQRRKWIERRAAAGDRRSHSLFLTGEGEKALVRIKKLAASHEAKLAEAVGLKRRILLMDLLRDFG